LDGLGEAEEHDLVDPLAVDGMRHRQSEVAIPEQLADGRILIDVAELDVDRGKAAIATLPHAHLIVALLLILDQERGVLDLQLADLKVHVPLDDAERNKVRSLDDLDLHAVDVGQLVPFGVHFPVVGVALGNGPLRLTVLLYDPRPKVRDLGIQLAVIVVVDEIVDLGVLVGRVVLVMELLEVVRGDDLPGGGAVARPARHHLDEQRVGPGERERNGIVIDQRHDHRLVFHKGACLAAKVDLGILHQVFPPKLPVLGGKWLPV